MVLKLSALDCKPRLNTLPKPRRYFRVLAPYVFIRKLDSDVSPLQLPPVHHNTYEGVCI